MDIINPASGEVIETFEADEPSDVASKVQAARAAGRDWAQTTVEDRSLALAGFREQLVSKRDELARTLSCEMGKPISQARAELSALLDRVDFFARHVPVELADEVVSDAGGMREVIRHEPLGTVANVSAWNYPYFVGANVFVPALLTGNTVLYKPSELATLTGRAIAKMLETSGVPEDVFVPVYGDGAAGAALVSSPVDGVFFTGSRDTGKKIAAAVATRLVRLQLELGGKDPAYVTDDVDVAAAAAAVADGAFYNTGQGCCAVERVYVHADIWDRFCEAFVETVRGFRVGDPLDEDTYIGPLARRELQLEVLERQVADARARGATIATGGARIDRPGYFFEPTVVLDADHDMAVMREESFGPIIALMKVDGDERALELMNDTEYGLTAAVYGRDEPRAEAILRQLDVGSAYFNCCDRVSPRLPWSGRRDSGIGCTLSTYGIEAFLRPKAWYFRSATSA